MPKKIKPETIIRNAIRDYLRVKGWSVIRIYQSQFSERGIPDLYALKNGRGIWIEVKTPNPRSKLSSDQEQFGRGIKNYGGEWFVFRSIDECMEILP